MNSAKTILLITIALISMNLSCGKDPSSPGEPVCIAMLAYGITFDDLAFLQSCRAGLERAKAQFEIMAEYDLDTREDNYYERLAGFAERGCELIIAIGYMWNDAVLRAADEHPDQRFVLVDAELSEPRSNVISIIFDVDEAAYPLGYLAAWWAFTHDTDNPGVGYVGAMEIPQIMQFIEPYRNGVARFNAEYGASVAIYGGFSGSFVDFAEGERIAESLIDMGADVIFGVGGQSGNGALHKAKALGKWGIGVDVDQFVSYPEVSDILISSAVKALDNAIFAVIESFMHGDFAGGIHTGNLANAGVAIAPYHDFETHIPDSVISTVEAIKEGIINGEISTGW